VEGQIASSGPIVANPKIVRKRTSAEAMQVINTQARSFGLAFAATLKGSKRAHRRAGLHPWTFQSSWDRYDRSRQRALRAWCQSQTLPAQGQGFGDSQSRTRGHNRHCAEKLFQLSQQALKFVVGESHKGLLAPAASLGQELNTSRRRDQTFRFRIDGCETISWFID
jgi:hypothetical protein